MTVLAEKDQAEAAENVDLFMPVQDSEYLVPEGDGVTLRELLNEMTVRSVAAMLQQANPVLKTEWQ